MINPVGPRSINNMSLAQRTADKIGGAIPKFVSNSLEMDQRGTLGRVALLTISFLFVLGARFIKSRDEHERREVLTRDGATIGVAMVGVPIVKNWMQRGLDKISKIPVAIKRDKLFCLDDFGFGNVKNWYSKANMMPEKALSVAKFIQDRGGDVAKAFSKLGDEGAGYLRTMLNGKECNSKNILEALENTFRSGSPEAKAAFEGLTNILSNAENGLVKTAQIFKAIPNISSIIAIMAVLGYGIPAFNIRFTRKIVKAGHHEHHNPEMLEPKLSKTQQKILSGFLPKA